MRFNYTFSYIPVKSSTLGGSISMTILCLPCGVEFPATSFTPSNQYNLFICKQTLQF